MTAVEQTELDEALRAVKRIALDATAGDVDAVAAAALRARRALLVLYAELKQAERNAR